MKKYKVPLFVLFLLLACVLLSFLPPVVPGDQLLLLP